MQRTSELRVLFPTAFSDACFRTSRAIAQLADLCRVSLTIAHVAKPGTITVQTRRELDSFLAEADHYDNCHRVLIEASDPVEALKELADRTEFDLIMAPASDRLGVHRLLRASFRARLIQRCQAPVWTVGNALSRLKFKQSLQTVACVIDFDAPGDTHLRLATALAARTGAKLRIVTTVAPVNEGTLAQALHSRAPLMPEVAVARIRDAFAGRRCPEVDVAVGDPYSEIPKLLSRADVDLAFVGPGQALNGVWRPHLTSYLDRLPCPVICADGASANFPGWSFERGAAYADAGSSSLYGTAIAS